MKMNLAHNWISKILSLLLAIAIWFLIKDHLAKNADAYSNAPRAYPVYDPAGTSQSGKKNH
jgi:YbbR domain-containing protein